MVRVILVGLPSLRHFNLSTVALVNRDGSGALLDHSRSNLLLGGLDGLIFPVVIQAAGQLVENDADKAPDEGSHDEQPDVTLVSVRVK